MGDESHPGQDPDDKLDASDDWMASFRDVVFPWAEPGHVDERPPRPGDEFWRTLHDRAASRDASAATAALRKMPSRGRSRTRVEIVAAMVVVLVVVAAVGAVALIGRKGRGNSSSSAATTAQSESSTTRSAASTTTTLVPASAPSSTPTSFTVQSACSGRNCTVAVRETPSAKAKMASSLRAGDAVRVTCSTHGEVVVDRDTGQQSDLWYRLADSNGYSSALYLSGPTVPNCG